MTRSVPKLAPIRVLWVVANVPPYYHVRFEALAKRREIELTVVEIAASMVKYPWTRVVGGGYAHHTLYAGAKLESLNPALVAARVLRVAQSFQPDVYVTNGYSNLWSVAPAALARTTRRLSLTVFDSTFADRERNQWTERFKTLLLRSLFDGVFCAGTRSREYLAQLGFDPGNISDGYDVVDNAHFALQRELTNPELPSAPYFLAVSRFAPEKNLLRLIDAYELYARSAQDSPRPPWSLILCGSGPLDRAIQARAAQLEAGRLILPGFLGYDQLPEIYQRSGCLVLPSVSEPWGLVVNEAMAAGVPVIVSERCGCAPDLVEEGRNGFLFDPNNTMELAKLLERVGAMSDSERRAMGRSGQHTVTGYTPETWTESFLSLLERFFSRQDADTSRRSLVAERMAVTDLGSRRMRTSLVAKTRLVDRDAYLMDMCRNQVVLHVGCTDAPLHVEQERAGRLLQPHLLRAADTVVGIDINAEALEWMQSKWPAEYHRGSIEDSGFMAQFSQRGFDVVLFCDVLEHVGNPLLALENLRRVMSPTTRLVVTVPNAYALKSFVRVVGGREMVHPDHVSFHSFTTLSELLDRAAFDVTDVFSFLGGGTGLAAEVTNRVLRIAPRLAEGVGVTCRVKNADSADA